MGDENVVHTQFSPKTEASSVICRKMMELEIIILSKRSQTQKDTYCPSLLT